MLSIADVKAVFLDHTYCKKVVFDVEFQQDLMASKEQKMADNWEEIGFEFQPPGHSCDVPLSALSPAHSIDSGFDNEMNLLGEIEGIDLDSVMESIFNTDMNSNVPNQKTKALKPVASTQPTTSVTATDVKATDEVSEAEKCRKNAIAARENRLKKKKYVEGIEKELEQLRKENEVLKAKDRRHSQVVEKLKNEVSFLRNVLANQSTLSVLLERLVTTPGINFATNLESQDTDERPSEDQNDSDDVVIDDDNDEDVEPPSQAKKCKEKIREFIQTRYQTRGNKRSASCAESSSSRKKARIDEAKGGVCLHVGQDKVSLAFCSQCSVKASGNTQR